MKSKYLALAATLYLSTAMSLPVSSVQAKRKERNEPQAMLSIATAEQLRQQGTQAVAAGDAAQASLIFAELVARNPRDAAHQTLLGLSYHLKGKTDPDALTLAAAGYDLASRSEPGLYWPSALAGRAAFDQGRYSDALELFARAAALKPSDARVIGAVAAAAYMSGDTALAELAAERASDLQGGADAGLLRIAAMAAAANGSAAKAKAYALLLADVSPDQAAPVTSRIAQLAQTNALDAGLSSDAGAIPAASAPDQISLDVAIILSQNTQRERTGFNLLDGLSLQYGWNRNMVRSRVENEGNVTNGQQRVITAAITIPQLNYNLNLFNRGGQFYSVVARPQLTTYRGEQSEFFVGRTSRVAVSGVNLGTLEQIDIGIELKVTPLDITADGTKVRIETGRSFLTTDPAGSFSEALATFRQKVAATAEIRFGETLLLSGLNETVEDRTFSKTPVMGDIPLVGNAFNERNKTMRKDSVIVLVTPARPVSLPGRPWARSEHVARLATLWTDVIDPASNAESAAERLSRMRLFTRMTRSDVVMPFPDAGQAAGEVMRDLAMLSPNP